MTTLPAPTPSPATADRGWLDRIEAPLAPGLRQHPWPTSGVTARALDRTTIQTPALDAIDRQLVHVTEGRCERLIRLDAPAGAKVQAHLAALPALKAAPQPEPPNRDRVLWPRNRPPVGRPNPRRPQSRAAPHLGLTLSEFTRAKHEFEPLGYRGGVVCVGIEGGLTGRPVDLLIIDDPYKEAN